MTIVHVTHDIDEAVPRRSRAGVQSRAGRVVGSIEVGLAPTVAAGDPQLGRFLACRDELHALIGSQQALR